MITLTAICLLLLGLMLAQRLNYLIVVPATIVTLIVTFAIAIAQEYTVGLVALFSVVNITALQAGYFAGAMILVHSRQRRCIFPTLYRRLLKKTARIESQ